MSLYPDMIEGLPEIDTPLPGIRGWLFQGERNQIVFFDIEKGAQVPPHSHCAQWGLVIEGEMALTIGGDPGVYHRGDRYFIPEGVVHAAEFRTRVFVMDVFADAARYKIKAGTSESR
jgi:quercetin dioxygenase-like cupin family protein